MKKVLWISFLIAARSAQAFDFDAMEPNRWHHVAPAYDFGPHGGSGARYENRHWCNLRYNKDRKTMVFYGGFSAPAVGASCIYANALYEYFPLTDEVRLESLANWMCNTGTGGSTTPESFYPLPNLPATPKPRHTYSQFAYVSSGVFLLHGSMGSDQHLKDFWEYSYDNAVWTKRGDNVDPNVQDVPPVNVSAGWANIYDNNLLYHPPSRSLYFFFNGPLHGGNPRAIHAYNLDTRTWSALTGVTGTPSNIGGHGLYDPVRDRFAFFGSAYAGNSSQIHIYNAVTRAWTTLSNPGGVSWPAGRNNAGLQYNPIEDVYMLLGADGFRDLWIFNPDTDAWTDLTPAVIPALWPPAGNEDGAYNLAFHEDLNSLVRYDERDGSMWLYRYSGGNPAPPPSARPRRLRVQ